MFGCVRVLGSLQWSRPEQLRESRGGATPGWCVRGTCPRKFRGTDGWKGSVSSFPSKATSGEWTLEVTLSRCRSKGGSQRPPFPI